ncbi:adenylate kinase [Peribacillus frigoritolerans]|uniref:adenylate kinase n=1 Tax=Peribacillus frigoritolerans TaxID=450367 RepID=UPI0034E0648F
MANKKKLKQRKKRQLKKAFKQAVKAVKVVKVKEGFSPDYLPPYKELAVGTKAIHKERDKGFQKELDKVYGGTVKPLTSYVNERATLVFHCSGCGINFFGRPSYMVGENANQRHRCHRPYGTTHGKSTSSSVSAVSTRSKKKKASLDIAELDRMVWEDYSYQQIAKELQVNPKIIKDYFIREGLIMK